MLTLQNLSCHRNDHALFQPLSFSVKPGDIWQMEGPNGVGKTTLLRVLAGLNPHFAGAVRWNTHALNTAEAWSSYWHHLTYMGHAVGIKPQLTTLENLAGLLRTRIIIDESALLTALIQLDLSGCEDRLASQLSAGQQRRIALARLWLEKTKLWILDEPFVALDKNGVALCEQRLVQHAQAGGMVILTTHQPLQLDYPIQRITLSE